MPRSFWIFSNSVKRRKGGQSKGENVFAWPLPFSEPGYSPASACYSGTRKKMHYCGPDGNIPHDQTNQSPWWDAGVTQPCSNTPFHSLSGTNTWSPINGTPRTHEEGCFSAASLVHGWWLHNHTSILSEERSDELPNNVSHHVNTNTVMDAASVGTLTCSPSCIMWAHNHRPCQPERGRGQSRGNKTTFNKLEKYPPVGYENQVSVRHQSASQCSTLDAKQLLNNKTTESRGEGQGRIHTWFRNADPAPSTVGIFPYTENPCKHWAVYTLRTQACTK